MGASNLIKSSAPGINTVNPFIKEMFIQSNMNKTIWRQTQGIIVIRQKIKISAHNKLVSNLNNAPLFCPMFKSFIEKKKSKTNAKRNNIIGNTKLLQYAFFVVSLNIDGSKSKHNFGYAATIEIIIQTADWKRTSLFLFWLICTRSFIKSILHI